MPKLWQPRCALPVLSPLGLQPKSGLSLWRPNCHPIPADPGHHPSETPVPDILNPETLKVGDPPNHNLGPVDGQVQYPSPCGDSPRLPQSHRAFKEAPHVQGLPFPFAPDARACLLLHPHLTALHPHCCCPPILQDTPHGNHRAPLPEVWGAGAGSAAEPGLAKGADASRCMGVYSLAAEPRPPWEEGGIPELRALQSQGPASAGVPSCSPTHPCWSGALDWGGDPSAALGAPCWPHEVPKPKQGHCFWLHAPGHLRGHLPAPTPLSATRIPLC